MQINSLKFIKQGSDARSAWVDVAIYGAQPTVTQEVAELLLQQRPSLALHACKPGTFGEHLPGALLPHALEHLAIDLLVERSPGESFAGNTCWFEREEQIMRVRISLPKDGSSTLVYEALSDALIQLNGILGNNSRQTGQ